MSLKTGCSEHSSYTLIVLIITSCGCELMKHVLMANNKTVCNKVVLKAFFIIKDLRNTTKFSSLDVFFFPLIRYFLNVGLYIRIYMSG